MNTCFENRTFLVTGASSGIGKTVALKLAALGAEVILLGKSMQSLEKVYDEIVATGAKTPAIYALNLLGAGPQDYENCAEVLAQQVKKLDGVIHVAGQLGVVTPIAHYPEQTWHEVIQVHLNAPFMLTKACLPLLEKSDQPVVAFTDCQIEMPYAAPYHAAKAGLRAFADSLTQEYLNKSLETVMVSPSGAPTKLRAKAFPGEDFSQLPTLEAVALEYIQSITAKIS